MAKIPFIGPSYDLDSKVADVQRTINMIPVPLEPGNERTGWVFKDVPGLELFNNDSQEIDPLFARVILLANFATDATDSSGYNSSYITTGTPSYSNGMTTGSTDYVTWSGSQFNAATSFTMEAWVQYSTLTTLNNEYLNILRLNSAAGTDPGLGWRYSDGRSMFNAGNVSGGTPTVAADTPVHLCSYIPVGAAPTCIFSVNGADMGTVIYSGRDTMIGAIAGEQTNGSGLGYVYKILGVRVTEGDRYGSATFTPDPYPFPEH